MELEKNTDSIRFSANDQDMIVTVLPYAIQHYDEVLAHFFSMVASYPTRKLEMALYFFLDQPYFLEPLGEGENGDYSQEPLYRTDQFDCVSYVNTILALLNAKNLAEFKQNILRIRYINALPNYTTRTDWFTDLEWIPHVRGLGWIQEATEKIVMHPSTILKMARTVVDKPNWYRVRPFKALHLFNPLIAEKAQSLLQALRNHEHLFEVQESQITYLPLDKLFTANGESNHDLFKKIPSPSVIVIVRPDWQIKENFPGFPQGYGTNLNVSHLGIAMRTEKGLMFYHASSLQQKVMVEPLEHYLKKYINSPTIKGIHIEQIV